jgi:hypothetical protein
VGVFGSMKAATLTVKSIAHSKHLLRCQSADRVPRR